MTQSEYIEILLNDCGIDTTKKRNAWLTSMLGRDIKYLDTWHPNTAPHGMIADEKSIAINALKDMKAALSPRGKRYGDDD